MVELTHLIGYKLYSKIPNDKLKAERGKFLLERQNGI